MVSSLHIFWIVLPISVGTLDHAGLLDEQSNHPITYIGAMFETFVDLRTVCWATLLLILSMDSLRVDHIKHRICNVYVLVPNYIHFFLFVENQEHHAGKKQVWKSTEQYPSSLYSERCYDISIYTNIVCPDGKHAESKDKYDVRHCDKSVYSFLTLNAFSI